MRMTYLITVKVSEEYSFFSEFNLDIRDDDCCVKSISLSAAAGGSVNISCKYPQSHISDVKFLCWRSGADLCAEETSVKESRRWSPEGKIQLYDDREKQLLTGRISHVTEQHSEYWCGVQSDQAHELHHTGDCQPYWLFSDLHFRGLVLLLISVPMFLVAVRKNKKTHGLFRDQVTQVSCSYVTVSKTDLHSDLNHTDTRTTAVYSAVHLPINPSDKSKTTLISPYPVNNSQTVV